MMPTRTYDLVLWGATGFTGKLVAQYLHDTYGESIRWAIAGRSESKLMALRQQLNRPDLPMILADSHDRTSLDAMTSQSKVVCSTVGPYALRGSDLVAACVAQGTHYCDLTGEVQWMRRMIDQHHADAEAKGVKIVHTCGFDSIPSDMGVYFLQQHAQQQHGQYCDHVRYRFKGGRGGFSGGTLASLNNILDEAVKDRSLATMLADPYSLNPEGQRQGPDGPDLARAEFDPVAESYIGPFFMGAINTRVVRRSHALQGHPYGEDFRYDEAIMTGKGFGGQMAAWTIAGSTGLFLKATPGSPMRWFMDTFLPKPGQGPSPQAQTTGFFKVLLLGTLPDGHVLRATVKGSRDPGYGATAQMLAESAICLALDELPERGGVLPPSVAMGEQLLKRLQEKTVVTFDLL